MVTESENTELLGRSIEVRSGITGVERPSALIQAISEDAAPLLSLANRHIVSARQFDRDGLLQISRLAAKFEVQPSLLHLPLLGKIMITAFYEPSTRTRLSFESAWHRLGGDVISITDPSTTGIAKGESLGDVAEMFSNYGDVVVLRDGNENAVYETLEGLRIPIINAGNGIDEHPTQALADMYTILKWKPDLTSQKPADPVRVGIVGTPGKMRTVRSLLLLMALMPEAFKEIVVVNPSSDVFDEGQREELETAGLRIRVEQRLSEILPELDIVYINSIAWIGDTFERLTGDLRLSADSPLDPDAIVLHPLARGDELDTSLDQTPHNWYFAQARGAVFVRMALLTCLTQRVSEVTDAPLPSPNQS